MNNNDNIQLQEALTEIAGLRAEVTEQKKLITWHTKEDAFLRAELVKARSEVERLRAGHMARLAEFERVVVTRAEQDAQLREVWRAELAKTNASLATANALLGEARRNLRGPYAPSGLTGRIDAHLAAQPATAAVKPAWVGTNPQFNSSNGF
jgi:hypothetical protein